MHLLFNGPFYSARLYSSCEILQQMGKEQQPYCWLPVSPPPATVLELRWICLSEPTALSEEKQSHVCLGEELQAGWGKKYLKRTLQQVSPDYSLKGINAPGRRDWGWGLDTKAAHTVWSRTLNHLQCVVSDFWAIPPAGIINKFCMGSNETQKESNAPFSLSVITLQPVSWLCFSQAQTFSLKERKHSP